MADATSHFGHPSTFHGLPVHRLYQGWERTELPKGCACLFGQDEAAAAQCSQDDELPPFFGTAFPEFLREQAPALEALLVGQWSIEERYLQECGSREVVEALVEHAGALSGLQALQLGAANHRANYIRRSSDWGFDADPSHWNPLNALEHPSLTPLLEALPELQELRVRGSPTFPALRHDGLRTLAVEHYGLDSKTPASLVEAQLPRLERLELWLGSEHYGRSCSVDDLAWLYEGAAFPALKHLGLLNTDLSDALAKALAESPLLGRLEVLDLSYGSLSDRGVNALLKSPAFAGLKRLRVDWHYIKPNKAAALEQGPVAVELANPQGALPAKLREVKFIPKELTLKRERVQAKRGENPS